MKTRRSTPHTVPRYGRRAATTKMRVKKPDTSQDAYTNLPTNKISKYGAK